MHKKNFAYIIKNHYLCSGNLLFRYFMSELNKHKINFLVALINEFGQRFGLSNVDSYRYINQYGGVQMFLEHYDILHTLSFRDMVDGMTAYCKRQGGNLG